MIGLGFLGFDPATIKSLSIALSSRASDICQLSTLDLANVVMVDIDKVKDHEEWHTLKKTYNLSLIAVSHDAQIPAQYQKDFVLILTKPLRFTAMLRAVCEAADISEDNMSHITQASDASNAIDDGNNQRKYNVVRERMIINPDDYLLGRVLFAINSSENESFRLIKLTEGQRRSDGQWLIINKQTRMVDLSVSVKVICHVALMELKDQQLNDEWVLEKQYEEMISLSSVKMSIEEFLWMLTRDTIRNGELSLLDNNADYYLKHWPNLAQYSSSSIDIALSSFWVGNSISINEVSKKLSIPISQVSTFAACCLTAGFLLQRETTHTPIKEKPKNRLKNILSMILSKLERK